MEENRLKPMGDYDVSLFNEIYNKVYNLKKKLARNIDHRRFGVDFDEIVSWFDVKFIYAFNKYHKQVEPDLLQAYIIKSLQLYKFRIMRSAYTVKHTQDIIPVEDYTELEKWELETPFDNPKQEMLDEVLSFLKEIISDDAALVLEVTLNPPPFILSRMDKGLRKSKKIPNPLIAEYLGLGTSAAELNYIQSLRVEVDKAIEVARTHFNPGK